jgi:hypothetical protein
MKLLHKPLPLIFFFALILLPFACSEEEDIFNQPVTNDFRLLKVSQNGKPVLNGTAGLGVVGSMDFVFSHSLNKTAFEQAFSLNPASPLSFSYDPSGSILTVNFSAPLAYETNYTFSLPKGTYGNSGESNMEDLLFRFSTAAFEPPNVSLSTSNNKLFEGESVTITATLNRNIVRDASVTLVFDGSAEKDTDYTINPVQLVIPAGSNSASATLSATPDGPLEGEESILISLSDPVNCVVSTTPLTLTLGDLPPALELKGVMSLKIGGTSTNGRAIHLRALEDIADLSLYGLGIANNGGGSDGREINFPEKSVLKGDDLLLIRDIDIPNISTYFGDCYQDFEHIIASAGINFNGDDPFELYNGNTVIESYGDVQVQGNGLEWEYTGSWAFKINGNWEYAAVDCGATATSNADALCPYPFCAPLQLQGVSALLWDGSGTNGGKFVQVRANRDIADLSRFGLGVANNGGGTDGIEFGFPSGSAKEGDHILVAREPATLAAYLGACFDRFDLVFASSAMSQNGDDAIELFDGQTVIETYGDANVDGTGQFWDYPNTWAFKVAHVWTVAGGDCARTADSNGNSPCPYTFCN